MERIPSVEIPRVVESEPATNRSVERACALLGAFAPEQPRLTLGALAAGTNLPKPTAHRIVTTLVQCGFMAQHEDGTYALGFRLLSLGAIVRENLDVVRACAPAMERLARATGETVILGEADWAAREVTIVHRVDSSHTLSVLSPIGRRSAIPPGALGKALLIGLADAELEAVLGALPLDAETDRTHTDPDRPPAGDPPLARARLRRRGGRVPRRRLRRRRARAAGGHPPAGRARPRRPDDPPARRDRTARRARARRRRRAERLSRTDPPALPRTSPPESNREGR